MDINYVVLQILENAGVNLALSVLSELEQYIENSALSDIPPTAEWGAQLGLNWRDILQRPHGVVTVGIFLTLGHMHRGDRVRRLVLYKMQQWFALSGYQSITQKVQNARIVGQTVPTPINERSITERQSVEAHSDSKFGKLTI